MAAVTCSKLSGENIMKTLKILVVDDDQGFAKSLSNLMSAEGYQVDMAFTGEEAISKFQEQEFDITFMDVKLPGKNGVESFFEIQKLKPEAKVIMMTAYTVEQLLQQAIEGGAVATLRKPFDMDEVLQVLEKIKPAGIVLIADDDPEFIQSVKNLLIEEGYNIFVATNGEEAVNKILANGVDVLILDLRLPIMSGLEVYLRLKEHNRIVPTIIVTGYAEEEAESINQLNEMSVTGCLVKPFDLKELTQSIEKLFE